MQEVKTVKIHHSAIRFGQFYAQSQKTDNLYLVVGEHLAGKSLLIDLLTEKTIVEMKDQQSMSKVIVAKQNPSCDYQPIYFQTLEGSEGKSLFLQGFTLNPESNRQSMNSIKSLFIKEGIKNSKNMSIIMVIEDFTVLSQIIDHLLTSLNLYDEQQEQIAQHIAKHLNLIFSKAESEGTTISAFLQQFESLLGESHCKTTHLILEQFKKDKRHMEFLNATPSKQLAKSIRNNFRPSPLDPALQAYLGKTVEDEEIVISQAEEEEAIQAIERMAKYVRCLLRFVIKAEGRQVYDQLLEPLFGSNARDFAIQKMKNPDWRGKLVLEKLNIMSQGANRASFKKTLENFGKIMHSLVETAENRDNMRQVEGIIQFLVYLLPFLREDILSKKMSKITDELKECIQLIESQKEQPSPSKADKQQQKSIIKKQTLQKKATGKRLTPFLIFKSKVQNIQTNIDILEYCMDFIKEKEKAENYQWSDAIYPLRMVRDLLRQFDFSQQPHQYLFIEELLQLYLYNESYYEFERLLNLYIRQRALPVDLAKKLIPVLDQLKRFDSEVKVLNYLIAASIEDEQFLLFNEIKRRAVLKSHQQFMDRSDTKQVSSFRRKVELQFSFENLKDKLSRSGESVAKFMKGASFKHYLEGAA